MNSVIDKSQLTFLDHLEELRWCLVKSISAVILFTILSFSFAQIILKFLIYPIYTISPELGKLKFFGPAEGFLIHLKVSALAGVLVGLPVVFYQFWKFVSPGLYVHEKRYILPFVFFTTLFFISGATFANFVAIPWTLKFLLSYQNNYLEAMLSINSYLNFIIKIILSFGFVFELPIIIFFLTKIGLITPKFLWKNIKYAVVLILVTSAILTPPDVVSMILLSVPLFFIYLLSILVSRWAIPKSPLTSLIKN